MQKYGMFVVIYCREGFDGIWAGKEGTVDSA